MSKISVENLTFEYTPGVNILKNINLDFKEQSTAVIGQNGAGKTTFVKLLKGLLIPQDGKIMINGINTKDTTVAELSKHIGMVFQNPNDQIFESKIIDEVMFGPLNIFEEDKAYENAIKSLEMVGLKSIKNDNPYDLGLSERKLITIASIIAMDTDIIIFDEPTIAQDSLGKKRIGDIINALKSQGKLVITITHDMDFVADYFERVIVLNQGKVFIDDTCEESFKDSGKLEKAYLELPNVTKLSTLLSNKTYIKVDDYINYLKLKDKQASQP